MGPLAAQFHRGIIARQEIPVRNEMFHNTHISSNITLTFLRVMKEYNERCIEQKRKDEKCIHSSQ
jgi:hypothetical protein